ncbi:MAG: hypothetical protein DRH08_07340 [Deltaproteobacteria bacterium]|nr:MAG: hypothetical protein DRH08_07340 [Deltaproteobacteria bacterium]
MTKPLIVLALLATLAGCTDARRAKAGGYGDQHKVELYSGGMKVREWTSSGKVLSEEASDGYFFSDAETGALVEVSGDVVITRLDG